MKLLGIAAVAGITEVSQQQLRSWEELFPEYLSPQKSTSGQRKYSGSDVTKVRVLKRLSEEGLSVEEIRSQLHLGGV